MIIQRGHRNDYDHALRAAGARVKEIGYNYATFAYELERAIDEKTAAVFYLAGIADGSLPIRPGHGYRRRQRGPGHRQMRARNCRPGRISADLSATEPISWSSAAGKHIRGPQSSGFICGRKELILAAALQHQDMDVFPETWSSRNLIESRASFPAPRTTESGGDSRWAKRKSSVS